MPTVIFVTVLFHIIGLRNRQIALLDKARTVSATRLKTEEGKPLFRRYQAIFDLRSAALGLRVEPDSSAGFLTADCRVQLEALVEENVGDWCLSLDGPARLNCELAAASPENGQNHFLAATCVLLIDCLLNPQVGFLLEWNWEAFQNDYRKASPRVRAAIFNGYTQVFSIGKRVFADEIYVADSSTATPNFVLQRLRSVARKMTLAEQKRVATFDHGCEIDRQFQAIQKLLADEECRYPAGEVWYPTEIIELVAFGPDIPGFLACTALVLINDILEPDQREHALSYWESCAKDYRKFPTDDQNVLHDGFRFLYETRPEWDPYPSIQIRKSIPKFRFIP